MHKKNRNKQKNRYHSLRACSPIWVSEVSLARTRERGAEERRACNHPLQIFICTSPRRREISYLLSPAPRGFAARSRVLARLASLAQIGELARRLSVSWSFAFYSALSNPIVCVAAKFSDLSFSSTSCWDLKRKKYLNQWTSSSCGVGFQQLVRTRLNPSLKWALRKA